MKVNKIVLFIATILITLILSRCIHEGSAEASCNIKESKKNNLFFCECNYDKKVIYSDDTLHIEIEEAWIENTWCYKDISVFNSIYKNDSFYQLVIKIKDFNKIKNLTSFWDIGCLSPNLPSHPKECGLSYRGIDIQFDSLKFDLFRYKTEYTFKGSSIISSFYIINNCKTN